MLIEVCQKKDDAFAANELIKEIEDKINELKEKGILSPESIDELELAKLAFEREDYALSLDRARETQLTFVLESKGKVNVIQFTKDNYYWMIGAFIILFLIMLCLWGQIRLLIIKNRIKNLNKEELTIHELVREAQKDYFKKKIISSNQYNHRISNHQKRIVKIRKIRVKLRNRKAILMDANQEIMDIKKERKEINHLLKNVQKKYFLGSRLDKGQFDNEYQSYKERLQELHLEEKVLENRSRNKKSRKKFFVILHKICTLRGIFSKKKK